MKIRSFVVVILLLAGAIAAGYWLLNAFIDWSERPKILAEPQQIEFPPGRSLRALSDDLAEAGIIHEAELFELWVRLFENYSRFQAGTYRFEGTISPAEVINALIQGKTFVVYAFELTIPEGYSFRQIAEKLAAKGVGKLEEIMPLLSDSELVSSLKIPSTTLEGYLFPATYRFSKTPTAREFIAEATRIFWERLPKDYEKNVGDLGLSLRDAVIFASLIETETPFADEKPLVSEVIWNRLKSSTVLGIDSALIYGINDYRGDIKKKHLADASNPYNTRLHLGFPPTPICSPAETSLQAVLTPSKNGYLYYVLDPATDRHHFSTTAEEHSAFVRKLVNHRE